MISAGTVRVVIAVALLNTATAHDDECDYTNATALALCIQEHMRAFMYGSVAYEVPLPDFSSSAGQFILNVDHSQLNGIDIPAIDLPQVTINAPTIDITINLNWTGLYVNQYATLQYDMGYTQTSITADSTVYLPDSQGSISLQLNVIQGVNGTEVTAARPTVTVTLPSEVEVHINYGSAPWWVYADVARPMKKLKNSIKSAWWPAIQPDLRRWIQTALVRLMNHSHEDDVV